VVVAVREVAEPAAGQGLDYRPVGAGIRDHQVAAGPQHAGELGHHRGQFGDMGERQGAHHDIGVVVR
jgi:hypothetical protein